MWFCGRRLLSTLNKFHKIQQNEIERIRGIVLYSLTYFPFQSGRKYFEIILIYRGTSNLWFKNYLKGRKQFTSIRGVDSSLKEISCGVPQGSILGPILFLILINDLPKASKFFTILFADDTTLQLSSKSLHDLYDLANFELSKIEDWFKANKLTLNASKTKYILFKNKKDVSITSFRFSFFCFKTQEFPKRGLYFMFLFLFMRKHLVMFNAKNWDR